ncbi:protein zer-1 homolog isoform X2 [Cephus cinctus]|uniref:Protein zer-1 homolog n=1 Tax=Cephus cinctus TaxID=211228 RepID=A0AAJ7FU92_CEPCN|nr:protein zer-1 homolog isoform X2 [Cephus cinctus]
MAHLDALFNPKQYLSPEPLTDLCFKLICDNLDIISIENEDSYRELGKGLAFPSEICDKLIKFMQRSKTADVSDNFLSIFKSVRSTRLKRVKIVDATLSDESVLIIAKHKVTELELTDCSNLTRMSLEYINDHSENLKSLTLGGSSDVVPLKLKSVYRPLSINYHRRGYALRAPKLSRLSLWRVKIPATDFDLLLGELPNLTHLDLTAAYDIGNLSFYTLVPHLVSLTLYNVKINTNPQLFVKNVSHLRRLRHLDISQSNHKYGQFDNPNQVLAELIEGLPELVSLDIGGTNLAGRGVAERPHDKLLVNCTQLCDIPGLASRVNKPLQFLGLYGTSHGACRRFDIPAKVIAGDATEEQILIAARVCMNNRSELLQKVLNDLYHIFRNESCQRMDQALCTVLEAMEKHPSEKHIQISGSATLFYIVKMKEKSGLVAGMKRRIIGTLLTGMTYHRDEETMMRNGCLALCQFRIPQDVMWNYEALVKVLLYSARHAEPEGFVQRIGIYLLNSLACQVDGREKRLLGELGCVGTMLKLVEYRLESGIFDDVLEVAWSTMWNMTDETAINCQRFLDEQGMRLFLGCVAAYPVKEELLRNMMGLLGNVAEVKYLRIHLMQQQYVTVFVNLLHSDSDGIEVSYNAAGILAHMASDGKQAWTILEPTRDEVLLLMVQAIERWDLSAERNINYRSFLPLLRLLDVYHTPQCQYWAVWALANLTKVYPTKYCTLVENEGGMDKLRNLLFDSRPYERIKKLARQVILNCCHARTQFPSNSEINFDG